MSENSSKLILAGGILGLVFLITFGLFLSVVELVYSEPVELEPVAEVGPIIYDDDYIVEKFVSGLKIPTTMTFVGNDILVLEKNTGKVIRIQDNGVIYNEPALDLPVLSQGEAGLLGIASVSNHVYLYFTESLSGFDKHDLENARNAVYQYDWNGENLTNPILIKELPGHLSPIHHGGVITTGLNNEIYFVIGDQQQQKHYTLSVSEGSNVGDGSSNESQEINEPAVYKAGSIFKVDTESNNNIELFAMGIRNSFGLAVDPVTGYLWETENGSGKFDEINLVKPRFNSGWNSVMGPADRVGSDLSTLNPKPFENFVYSDPEFSWYVTVAPTAIAFPDKDSFRKYSDSLFVGDYNNGRIYKFHLNVDRTGFVFYNQELSDLVLDDNDKIDEILFAKGFQGITDIKFHDGAMYVVVIGDGSIYKIYPKNILPPLKQYQNGVPHKKIVCNAALMPVMSKSGYIYCVYPKTALTFINVLNWSIDHPEMPKIELRFQDLSGLNFEYINLSNSDFRWSNFDTAKISNVNFTRTNLSSINLSGQDLTGTILTGADLSNANLMGVDLSGMDLTGTILTGANLSDTILPSVDLSGKDLTGTILKGADLSSTDLTGTILKGADLSSTDLSNTILINANLENATLENAKLLDANLDSANLTNADLRKTLLVDANLSNAILTGSDLTNAVLTGAILTGANLENAVLTNAILDCVGHPICIK